MPRRDRWIEVFARLRVLFSATRAAAAARDVHVAPTERASENPAFAGATRAAAAVRDVHIAPTERASENPVFVGATRASRKSRTAKQQSGDHAETAALAHLRGAGLTLIARNFVARGGELDLVMREGNTLVFVEVRYRADVGHGDGLDSVSTSKQRRLIAAARQFLADHAKYARWTTRFDAVALGAGGTRWVKNVIAIDEAGW